jgi:ankyrin repeat protein
VDARDINGQTPLYSVANGVSPEASTIAGLLLDRGADVNARDIDGHTPLHLVARKPAIHAIMVEEITERRRSSSCCMDKLGVGCKA